MTIYLYKKTHNQTGLQYLGKTVSANPDRYSGSGTYWSDHINKHGYDVTTEILKECQTNEELRYWGLYYSELWNIVDARDENGNKTWANLRPETGDGFDSETARQTNLTRIAEGKHHFLGVSNPSRIRSEDGTHHFLGGEISRKNSQRLVAEGRHNFLGGEIQRKSAHKRIMDGSHNLLGGEMVRKLVAEGKHHFLGGETTRKQLENGTHSSQQEWSCEHCGKSGKGSTNFKRWHGDNCKYK